MGKSQLASLTVTQESVRDPKVPDETETSEELERMGSVQAPRFENC